jgi:formate/nitrite transporter FocA (FNT family)
LLEKFHIAAPQRLGTHLADQVPTARHLARAGGDCMQEQTMDTVDYVKPADVATAMVEAGGRKLALAPRDLLIRGMLSGAILGVATSLAFTGAVQTNTPLVGALIFPVGLISIVLLGLELVTGSFALVPLPWLSREASASAVVVNWGWVFIGNLIGGVAYGALIAIALTNMGTVAPAGVAARIVQVAEAKTIGYSAIGFAGMVTVFVKAMLCNWMVCLAIVLAMTTNSVIARSPALGCRSSYSSRRASSTRWSICSSSRPG